MKRVILAAFLLSSLATLATACGAHSPEHSHDADIALLVKAVHFAAKKHTNHHPINSTEPMINFVAGIAYILTSEGNVTDAVTLATAYLHLTIRIQINKLRNENNTVMSNDEFEAALQEIGDEFGGEIKDLVRSLTGKRSQTVVQFVRSQIKAASKLPQKAQLVRLAGKLYWTRLQLKRDPELEKEFTYCAAGHWNRRVMKELKSVNKGLAAGVDEILDKLDKLDKKHKKRVVKCKLVKHL